MSGLTNEINLNNKNVILINLYILPIAGRNQKFRNKKFICYRKIANHKTEIRH